MMDRWDCVYLYMMLARQVFWGIGQGMEFGA